MKTITFTYEFLKEETGFSVKCLDWDCVFSQGETIDECYKNITEVTLMMLEKLKANRLDKSQLPQIKTHIKSVSTFQLSFDLKD